MRSREGRGDDLRQRHARARGRNLHAHGRWSVDPGLDYRSAFATLRLPALDAGLSWDTTRLLAEGTLTVAAGTAATTLAGQPATQTTTVGLTATFIGGAVGTEPIAYRWQFNGNDLAGETRSTLVLANVRESQQGAYRFIAQNSTGSVTSAPAILTVTPLPVAGHE